MVGEASEVITAVVFREREQAEAAIADLRRLGLTDEDLGLLTLAPGRYLLDDDTAAEAMEGVRRGIAVGVPLGSLAGIGLMAGTLHGLRAFGLGGILAGAPGGALWGAVLGGLIGLIARAHWDADEDQVCELPLTPGEVLVLARAGVRTDQARKVMARHGARAFLYPGGRVGELWRGALLGTSTAPDTAIDGSAVARVGEASVESFPASDASARIPMHV